MKTSTHHSHLRALAMALALLFTAATASAQDASARIDSLDRWFMSLRESKRSIPQATLQTWVRAQEALRDLAAISEDDATDKATAWRARYVAAYGYWMLELFDVSAAMTADLAASARDDRERTLALKDLAQSLENAGRFDESAAESERLIAATDTPGMLEYNNHALRLLKAGRYDEVLTYVNRIELDAKAAHTRIFAARALAYRGRYDSARAELTRACDLDEQAACSMLERLEAETPEVYWRNDRDFRTRAWQPYNRIDSAISLAATMPDPIRERDGVSLFAPSFWFNEVTGLYPSLEEGRDIVPTYPATLPKGRIGVGVLEGVPFVMIHLDPSVDAAAIDGAVAKYLEGLHGQSAWDDQTMKIATRALVAPVPKDQGGGHGVFIAHTDRQEELLRRSAAKGTTFRVIRTR